MSDDLERLLNPGANDEDARAAVPGSDLEPVPGTALARVPGTDITQAPGTAVEKVPVEGGRVARRLAEKAELEAKKKSKRAPRAPKAPKELGEGASTAKKPPKLSVVGVLGELLITAGVLVLMFLGWQIWINDKIVGSEQQHQAAEISQEWNKGEVIANIIIPRLGPDWVRTLREGIGINDVLNRGLGHYPDTQMPGEVGNFAIAGHRTGWGAPLENIVNLEVGDSIYVETEDGWYRYEYRSLEYVMPTGVQVLEAVPNIVGGTATDRILTITSCNPPLTAAERIISYAVYDTWWPRAGGPPAEIAGLVQAQAAAVSG